jgi:hypothetical protein
MARKRLRVEVWEGDLGFGGVRILTIKVIQKGWMAVSANGADRTITMKPVVGTWGEAHIAQWKKGPRQWSALPAEKFTGDAREIVIKTFILNRGDQLQVTVPVLGGSVGQMPTIDIEVENVDWRVFEFPRRP